MKFEIYNKTMQNRLSSNFVCGNKYLDKFLRSEESLDTQFGKTYVYLNAKKDAIVSYFNIGTGSIIEKNINYNKDIKMGGSAHLNCFALDEKYQGQVLKTKEIFIKLSDYLLAKCIKKILNIKSKYIGFSFITLYSTKRGYNLYKRFGFEDIEEDMVLPIEKSEMKCYPMYLPIMGM